jgi:RecB family exonuclease
MKEFLRSVAEHYYREAETEGGALGLADYLFVFPNRRSGLFFAHYLGETAPTPFMAPATTTISEIFGRLSPRLHTTDRMDLLFRLYGLYREMSGSQEEFDNFVFWGDMLLADFDDLDKYEVNARELFYNVRDIKEIELLYADYDPETIAIIRSFWTHFFPNDHDHKKEVFEQMWSILFDLYDRFRQSLAADGLAYEGQMMRTVVEALASGDINEESFRELLPYKKVVFVGLTAISKVDRHLMLRLKMRGIADFCWDYADPRLTDPDSRAAFFTADNLADFPNALSDEELRAGLVSDKNREVEVLAVPSGVGQAVQAGHILQRWMDAGLIDPKSTDKEAPTNAIHTAVVLPDEKLLMPMLYAVPTTLEPFNVTMGYSLRATPVAALMDDIIHLQVDTWRDGRSTQETFYFKPVQAILSHNYVCALCGRKATELNDRISREGIFRVPADLFAGDPLLCAIFRRAHDARDAAAYLHTVLNLLLQEAEAESAPQEAEADLFGGESEDNLKHGGVPIFSAVEREFLACYAQAVDRLAELMKQYPYQFKVATFFHLLQRLTQGEMVPFSGEPLAGLQLMGVLETRAVDFDNVIILSMNEGVFPAKSVSNTFIPMSLRAAFGMPTQRHRDAVFAYHFYRLCSRARRVTFLYDTRSGGMQTGEVSRYLLQLRHVYGLSLPDRPVRYEVGVQTQSPIVIAKDARIRRRLERYLQGGKKTLSASALKTYIGCPMKFYLTYVEDLREDDEVTEGIDGSQFGSVFHEALQRLYTPLCGRMVTADYLHALIDNRRDVAQAVEQAFADVMHVEHPEGYMGLVAEIIQEFVLQVLSHDAAIAPFTYIAAEYKQTIDYPVAGMSAVRMMCIYDRIDLDRAGNIRIIDYKTSAPKGLGAHPKTQFNSVSGLFDPDNKACSDEAMQVLLYCALLRHADPQEVERIGLKEHLNTPDHTLSPHLYSVRDFHQDNIQTILTFLPNRTTPPEEATLAAGPVTDYSRLAAPFEKALAETIRTIFDPERPFTQCAEGDEACSFCPFKTVCGR